MIDRVKHYFEEVRTEFRHVNWPTREEALKLTGVVIFISLAFAVFLGGFDFAFTQSIRQFILGGL
jgi:preprotein translocase subunit SecE